MPIPKNYPSPVRMSAKEKAFDQLQRWIIDGTLEPGEKLNDSELAEALGISRTPIREALQLLEVQGFVETFPGRETRITQIKKTDVLKVYPPLASLQALAAAEASKIITSEQAEELRTINQKYDEAIKSGQPFKAMTYDEHFHQFILEIADNPYIDRFSLILQLHMRRFKYIFLNNDLTLKSDSVNEHNALINALIDHNAQLAADTMSQNWLRPMNEVYQLLK
ncbi:GntR family transcriptional regulator [Sporolactobacillus shoreae]|uniref:GntR family transcriptional regulator n=1 Tax=Sporolactobacillus shoreae TaxID=1465501 RepID=A0A4Z0GHV3_9BACL|nr:GntR family transcriptional regulator [Sporolactobacillus shoreae]TGA96295.1 GntR family transcriptional regulator [Sporolactobacillus shoreae]